MKKQIILAMLLANTYILAQALDFNSSNIYVDGNVGANTAWDNIAFDVNAGYMLNQYIGAELGWAYSPGDSYNSGMINYSTDFNMLDLAAKGVLPISSAMNVFGKVGVAYNNYSGSYSSCNNCGSPPYAGSNLATLIGAGFSYDLNQKVALHLEDDYIVGSNPNLILAGVEYKFK